MRPREPPDSPLSPGPRIPGILDDPALGPSGYDSAALPPAAPSTSSAHDDDLLMTDADADDESQDSEEGGADAHAYADDEEDNEEEDEEDSDIDLDDYEDVPFAPFGDYYGHQNHTYYHNQQDSAWDSFLGPYDGPSDEHVVNSGIPSSLGPTAHMYLDEMDAATLSSSSGEFVFSPDESGEEYSEDESASVENSPLMYLVAHPGHSSDPMPPPTLPGPPPVTLLDAVALSTNVEHVTAVPDDAIEGLWFHEPPVAHTNPNPFMLGPGNYGLADFLQSWAAHGRAHQAYPNGWSQFPAPGRILAMNKPAMRAQEHIQYADLEGNACDLQGINWDYLGVTREEARERRLLTYNNYVHQQGSDRWHPNLPDTALPRLDSFFRFRRMDLRRNVNLSHFQLRNILAAPRGRNVAYYPSSGSAVHEFNLGTGKGRTGMKLRDGQGSQVTTLAAECGVLAGGCFNGEYLIKNLGSEADDEWHEGVVTSHISAITNHVEVHQPRSSSSPVAAFASNDLCFRLLDVATETWLSEFEYEYAMNCTAISPDGRLRAMVGDSFNVLIALAEPQHSNRAPTILHELSGHRDWGFACAWADDGVTVATGFQDKAVKIWDARRWVDSRGMPNPVCTLRSEMAGVRSLRFSPVGSGRRVLVAAEEADYVNVIDAQTFRSKQTFDIFGEIGGVNFANEGQDLMVLCCDRGRGGVMQLERCGLGDEGHVDLEDIRPSRYARHGFPIEKRSDWPRSMFTEERRARENNARRRRKAARLDSLEPF